MDKQHVEKSNKQLMNCDH